MIEHPTLFKAVNIPLILDGTKTQTRHIVKRSNSLVDGHRASAAFWATLDFSTAWADDGPSPAGNPGPYLHVTTRDGDSTHRVYPKWQKGDVLWVREAWAWSGIDKSHDDVWWKASPINADGTWPSNIRWRSPLFMPRRASRADLDVLEVRVQRVQEISEADAKAEGVEAIVSDGYSVCETFQSRKCARKGSSIERATYSVGMTCNADTIGLNISAREIFSELWDSVNGPGAWQANDWTWPLTFRRKEAKT